MPGRPSPSPSRVPRTGAGRPAPGSRPPRRGASPAARPSGAPGTYGPSRGPGRYGSRRPSGQNQNQPAARPTRPVRRHRSRRAMGSFLFTFLITMALLLPCALGVGFYLRGKLPAETGEDAPSSSVSTAVGVVSSNPGEQSQGTSPAVDLSGLNSAQAILIQRGGDALGEQNADDSIYPASLTKMMTVLLAAENFPDLDASVTLTDDLFAPLWSANASMAGFQPGETVTVRDLLYGAMLPSGAECCAAIAKELDGDEAAFADRMNRRAEELGMTATHFTNATGLQDENHVTTVRDMARLLDAALDNDTFREVFTARRYSTRPTNLHPDGITVYSSAFSLLEDADLGSMTLLGGKTGFTDEAGLCLATLVEGGGKEYILVTAGAPGKSHTDTAHARDASTVCRRLSDALQG